MKGTLRERFDAKVSPEPNSGCWLWLSSLTKAGYGQVSVNRRMRLAHRVSYSMYRGLIPEGFELDHLCRNRACVNPVHLEVVTSRENTLRGESPSAMNARKRFCKRGHEFSADNTYHNPSGKRQCKACKAAWVEAHKNG